MATVTGKTSAKIDELFDSTVESAAISTDGQFTLRTKGGASINAGTVGNTIVSAAVNSVGRLIFTTRGGAVIDAGLVKSPALESWPVGSLFFSSIATNPASLLGGGTWAAWGTGRMPVGIDPSQAEFDGAGEIGGSKTAAIYAANMPSHSHNMPHSHAMNHGHSTDSGSAPGGSTLAFARSNNAGVITGGGVVQPIVANTGGASSSTTDGGPGYSLPFSTLPPYITCYIWRRTA